MTECTDPEGHLFNKWAIEGGAVCSLCGEKLSLGETLAMLCEHAALKRDLQELQVATYRFIHRPEIWIVRGTPRFKVDAGLMNDEIAALADTQESK